MATKEGSKQKEKIGLRYALSLVHALAVIQHDPNDKSHTDALDVVKELIDNLPDEESSGEPVFDARLAQETLLSNGTRLQWVHENDGDERNPLFVTLNNKTKDDVIRILVSRHLRKGDTITLEFKLT